MDSLTTDRYNGEKPLFVVQYRMDHYDSFMAFYYLHYIFNDVVCVLLTLFIDYIMIREVHKGLKIKQATFNKSIGIAADAPKHTRKRKLTDAEQKKQDEITKADRDIIKLILFSLIVYLICRGSELFF